MIFRPYYAVAAAILLVLEIGIAAFMHDRFIRPYGGDMLAVVLVYAGLRAITPMGVKTATLSALAVAFAIEFGQLFHVLELIGLGHNRIARIVLGGVFDVQDIACYVVGALCVWAVETLRTSVASGRARW
jgi:hypothetical protein